MKTLWAAGVPVAEAVVEMFGALGQVDESDADSESESMCGCEVPRTCHLGNSVGEPETLWGLGLVQPLQMEQ